MWHKAIWKEHPMRLELTRVGLLVVLVNHYTTTGAYFNPVVVLQDNSSSTIYSLNVESFYINFYLFFFFFLFSCDFTNGGI